MTELYNQLQNASSSKKEKDVEHVFKSELERLTKTSISSPYNTDGILTLPSGKCLLEFKFDEKMKDPNIVATVLCQCVFYLHAIQQAGDELPKTILIGDLNEVFVIPVNNIQHFLLIPNVDWAVAPSESHKISSFYKTIRNAYDTYAPIIYDIDEDFNMKDIILLIDNFNKDDQYRLPITETNFSTVFAYFNKFVLPAKNLFDNIEQRLGVFMKLIIDTDAVSYDKNGVPSKIGDVSFKKSTSGLSLNASAYKTFERYYDLNLSKTSDKANILAIKDKILGVVDDVARRKKGEFFTPKECVDEANRYMELELGSDYRQKYVVWDPCCGTGGLTVRYKYAELYQSTLEQSDIDLMVASSINPKNSTKFQFDFLNDDDSKLPPKLLDHIKNGTPIVVFMNPPYVGTGNAKNVTGVSTGNKTNTSSSTMISNIMKKNKIDGADNLYIQFVYKTIEFIKKYPNAKIEIFMFSKVGFLELNGCVKFRKWLITNSAIIPMFVSHSKTFGTDADYPIAFTRLSPANIKINRNVYKYNVFAHSNTILPIRTLDKKDTLKQWLTKKYQPSVVLENESIPTFSSPLKIQSGNKYRCMVDGSIGFLMNHSNNIEKNDRLVSLFSTTYGGGSAGGEYVFPENMIYNTFVFTARRLISGKYHTWLNDSNEYKKPIEIIKDENGNDIINPTYTRFRYDSIIYALFNSQSFQVSLRNIIHNGTSFDFKNEFFWMSNEELTKLADVNNFDDMYNDAVGDDERFVYTLLNSPNFENTGKTLYELLSPAAQNVLNIASDKIRTTIIERKSCYDNGIKHVMKKGATQEEYDVHFQTWDAGWYQMKHWLSEQDIDDVNKAYEVLANELRPLVYELDMLLPTPNV